MGDYEAAVEEARKALKIAPDDQAAWATLKLSEDRIPSNVDLPDKWKLDAPAPDGSAGRGADDTNPPYKLPVKVGAYKAVPSLTREPEDAPLPENRNLPLWPIGAGAGLGLAAYGVHRSRRTWASQEFDGPQEESPGAYAERLDGLKYKAKVGAVALAAGFGIIYGGPFVWRAAVPAVATAWQQGRASFQRVATSEAGALLPREASAVKRTAEVAESIGNPASAFQAAQLNRHLYQTAEYGKTAVRHLKNGRIRYYDVLDPANKAGEMLGRRRVREWDPSTLNYRTWFETVDHTGKVRIVRPEAAGPKLHYMFDSAGNHVGTF